MIDSQWMYDHVGFLLLGGILLFFLPFGVAALRRDQSQDFDERQLLYRNRAWKYAAWVMIGAGVLAFFLLLALDFHPLKEGMICLLIPVLGYFVFVEYTLIHDAFFKVRWGPQPVTTAVLMAVFTGACSWRAAETFQNRAYYVDGGRSMIVFELSLAVCTGIAAVTLAVKLMRNRE